MHAGDPEHGSRTEPRDGTPVAPDDYEGIRLYWAPRDLPGLRAHLARLGYAVTELAERGYGQTEFFVTDDDGYSHCFGVATVNMPAHAGEERLADA